MISTQITQRLEATPPPDIEATSDIKEHYFPTIPMSSINLQPQKDQQFILTSIIDPNNVSF